MAERAGQIFDLGNPPLLRRDTFKDILDEDEEEVPVTPQKQVQFANVATSTPVPKPVEQPRERTQSSTVSQVLSTNEGLFRNLRAMKGNCLKGGFSCKVYRQQPPSLKSCENQRWQNLREVIPLMLALFTNCG